MTDQWMSDRQRAMRATTLSVTDSMVIARGSCWDCPAQFEAVSSVRDIAQASVRHDVAQQIEHHRLAAHQSPTPFKQLTDAWQMVAEAIGMTTERLRELAGMFPEPDGPLPMSEHVARHRDRLAQRIREVNARRRP